MTITVGVAWGEVSALMAYIKQSFQKFFILLFVRIPSPHEESHVQICSESTGVDELLLSSCLILSRKVFRVIDRSHFIMENHASYIMAKCTGITANKLKHYLFLNQLKQIYPTFCYLS